MGRIVVGVDGSDHAAEALRWAAKEARLRGATLEAVLVWSYLDQALPPGEERFRPDYGEDDARDFLEAAVAGALGGSAEGLDVRLRTICDLPARGLIDAALEADLVVVGSRGLGGFKGLLLGSVGDQVVRHAACPVVVVRSGDAGGA